MRLELSTIVALALAVGVTPACDGLGNAPLDLPALDFGFFVCAVQPILDRECATPACHGNPARGLQVLSSSRMRIAGEYQRARADLGAEEIELGMHPALTDVELSFNYEQCRAFALPRGAGGTSQLLSRPLAVAAGGVYHDERGDIFASADDPSYRTLERWLLGATGESCP